MSNEINALSQKLLDYKAHYRKLKDVEIRFNSFISEGNINQTKVIKLLRNKRLIIDNLFANRALAHQILSNQIYRVDLFVLGNNFPEYKGDRKKQCFSIHYQSGSVLIIEADLDDPTKVTLLGQSFVESGDRMLPENIKKLRQWRFKNPKEYKRQRALNRVRIIDISKAEIAAYAEKDKRNVECSQFIIHSTKYQLILFG